MFRLIRLCCLIFNHINSFAACIVYILYCIQCIELYWMVLWLQSFEGAMAFLTNFFHLSLSFFFALQAAPGYLSRQGSALHRVCDYGGTLTSCTNLPLLAQCTHTPHIFASGKPSKNTATSYAHMYFVWTESNLRLFWTWTHLWYCFNELVERKSTLFQLLAGVWDFGREKSGH